MQKSKGKDMEEIKESEIATFLRENAPKDAIPPVVELGPIGVIGLMIQIKIHNLKKKFRR